MKSHPHPSPSKVSLYLLGYRARHHDGRQTPLISSEFRAKIAALWLGCGWYVSPVRVLAPAFDVEELAS